MRVSDIVPFEMDDRPSVCARSYNVMPRGCGVLEGNDLATTGQRNGIVEGARLGHLFPSNEPGRVALVCRIISLRAPIAFHPGAELVERHGAEHGQSFAEHPERHPDRSLAALASDPGITFGL
jgi:hypothetical protein